MCKTHGHELRGGNAGGMGAQGEGEKNNGITVIA